jgi:multicomponent K+:H+ antiporter subunit D
MSQAVLAHLPVLPIAIPLLTAALAILIGDRQHALQRALCLLAASMLLACATLALMQTDGNQTLVYLVGNWQAPFGIALAVDRLSAMMLMLTAFVALVVLIASRNDAGRFFHPLFMLQWMGLNGAFLTADLFNLFVFFEVLLAASYGLLLQHADRRRTNAATHYVVINLVGSALFLLAVSLLYGITGTLNMSDLALRLGALSANAPQSVGLAHAALFVLIVVFAIKAALLPLGFWLTATYGAAMTVVAVLFALMTKVGIYSILRATTLIAPGNSEAGALIAGALLWVGPLTLLVAACGALAAPRLATLIGWTIVSSAGLLVTAIAVGSAQALSGGLYYLVGSTLAAALLFLLQSGVRDESQTGVTPAQSWPLVGVLFLLATVSATGLPPLPGFIGKATILAGSFNTAGFAWVWVSVLLAALITLIAYARMGSRLFWQRDDATVALGSHTLPALMLGGALLAMTVAAAPIQRFTYRAALDLLKPQLMTSAVMGAKPIRGARAP